MFVSRGLVDPKVAPNRKLPNGKPVNIPAPSVFCPAILPRDIGGTHAYVFCDISRWRVVMTRSRRRSPSPRLGFLEILGACESMAGVKLKLVPRTDTGAPG